ncbi:MAG: PilN domain-containing protein [Gammaproteobacteria bacterium]|nr:PilN domain-containing protein [Gammaproteobacteria bacterium]
MATRINLLDWRAARRERRKKRFFALLGASAGAALLLVGLGIAEANQAVDNQQARNRYLQQQIADLDQQIKEIQALEKVRRDLLSRMKVIEELQASRSATVHFFDEIVNTLPDGVYLTALKQNGDNVTIDGVAESNGRVSTYMKNLDASPWFSDPRLVVIKTSEKEHQRRSDFTLQVKNLTTATTDKRKQPEPAQ